MDQNSDVIMPEEFREIPLSGSYEEHDFGGRGLRCWFKFTDSDYVEWCGKFEPGTKPRKRKVLRLPRTRGVFILVDGRGYVVNTDTRQLLARTASDMLEDAVLIPEAAEVVITNGYSIGLFGPSGDIWQSEPVSLDGIEFGRVSPDRVTGRLRGLPDAWYDFTFHVDSRRIDADWTYARACWPAPVSQVRLARIVVATFGAAVTGLGIGFYFSDHEVYGVALILLGVSCMLIAIFASKHQADTKTKGTK